MRKRTTAQLLLFADEGGTPGTIARGPMITARPVVERRRHIEQRLRSENEFLSAVLETVDALVVVLDRAGLVVQFNAACERASGYRSEEVAGKSLWDLEILDPGERDDVLAVFKRLRAGESRVGWVNHWIDRHGGRRLIVWSNSVLRDGRGEVTHVLFTGIDVTEQRAAEDKLRARSEELAVFHRRYTASGLASIIAHELNQPLTAISAYAEAYLQQARADARLPADLVRIAENLAAEALRAGRVVNGLRRLIKSDSPELRTEDLVALAQSACEILAPLARGAGVRVRIDIDERFPAVRASAIQIEHVIINLVRNAIEAIRDAGKKAGEIVISARVVDGMAEVTVADNGPGIGSDQAEQVFGPYFTTKDAGLGMGLAICRTLVELHGGRIWAESGQGGRFFLTLPLAS